MTFDPNYEDGLSSMPVIRKGIRLLGIQCAKMGVRSSCRMNPLDGKLANPAFQSFIIQPHSATLQNVRFSTNRTLNEHNKSDKSIPQLTLFTGTDCQLCDVAKDVLVKIAKEHPFDLHLYNIRDDSLPEIAKWRRAYQYDIPVLHLNGQEIARHRLNEESVLNQIKDAALNVNK